MRLVSFLFKKEPTMISDPLAVKPSNEQSPVDHFLLGDHERYQT
jgi:hypothetical protein